MNSGLSLLGPRSSSWDWDSKESNCPTSAFPTSDWQGPCKDLSTRGRGSQSDTSPAKPSRLRPGQRQVAGGGPPHLGTGRERAQTRSSTRRGTGCWGVFRHNLPCGRSASPVGVPKPGGAPEGV